MCAREYPELRYEFKISNITNALFQIYFVAVFVELQKMTEQNVITVTTALNSPT